MMAARSIVTSRRGLDRVHSVAQSTAHARQHSLRKRLVVFGPSVRDVVRLAGGWMFDRVTSGWDVTAVVADHPDLRPFQILGVRTLDLDAALATPAGPHPHELAVSVDLFVSDERVRSGLLGLLAKQGDMSISMWGEVWSGDMDEWFRPGEHRLSGAARAFKGRALAAASESVAAAGVTESIWTDLRRGPGDVGLASAS